MGYPTAGGGRDEWAEHQNVIGDAGAARFGPGTRFYAQTLGLELIEKGMGGEMVWFTDPDGNIIRLNNG